MKEEIQNLEGEIWIENNGYKISNKGRIIGKKGILLKPNKNNYGYLSISIILEDGFRVNSVHRAVAYLFLGKPKEGQEVNHKDGNKENNCVENLEWVTKSENQQHVGNVLKKRVGEKHHSTKLSKEQVIDIYNMCKEQRLLYKEIAQIYDLNPSEVSLIAKGVLWDCLQLEPLPSIVRGSRKGGKRGIRVNQSK